MGKQEKAYNFKKIEVKGDGIKADINIKIDNI